MPRISIADLPWKEQHSPGKKFHSFCRDISLALGGIRNAGPSHGGQPFDLQIRRIPPGAAACPFHSHLAQWELFVVRSGTGTVREGDETHLIKTGDVFLHPPGVPHQLINTGMIDLEVLIIADHPTLDAFFYPDSNKWGLRPPGKYFRITEVDYFDGEETTAPNAPPYQPSRSPAAHPPSPFSQRKIHPDTLPWEPWASPKGRFKGTSKELSIGLGALRNTPVGLGGHPFDLELSKLAPGECGCPFHSHAAQTELFLILEGSGIVRAGDEAFTVHAGDVILHPPGEPHQLTNMGGTDLIFFLVADNPSVDIFYYPDSDKWGHRAPRKFFRATETDYWAGEE
jgi:uncharacterized cupin superfamily protein